MFKNIDDFKVQIIERTETLLGKTFNEASVSEKYRALAHLVKDNINKLWAKTNSTYLEEEVKQVYYFSLEFLMGKALANNLQAGGGYEIARQGLADLGISIEDIENAEPEAGLGNGGLGRLAACFLDSMSSMGLPGHGCGIRYKYGLFEQKIRSGYQIELPDNWLKEENVWEIRRPDMSVEVRFGGNVWLDEREPGKFVCNHESYDPVIAVPYDMPIMGADGKTVNTLRLWSSEAKENVFDFKAFSRGDYMKAVEYKNLVESITQVLYPDDSNYHNKVLRLKQQYFFVSAGLQSIVRRYKKKHESMMNFAQKVTIHVNDTHPAVAVPELMRILMDNEGFDWETAWDITNASISYTNHTILSEALEVWPEDIFRSVLPRIHMIVQEINRRFCTELLYLYPNNMQKLSDMSILSDGHVRMANLAIVGSYSVNGVAALHTDILKNEIFKNFNEFYPHKFNNKTNGVTHRRWLITANHGLSSLLDNSIGKRWRQNPLSLSDVIVKGHIHDAAFREEFENVKLSNKIELSNYIREHYNISVNPRSIFDVQIKRIHAYKRQLLNILRVIDLYFELKENPGLSIMPRTFLFAGKAAPSYYFAKHVIKLINSVADVVNSDIAVTDRMKIVFMENYNVSLGQMMFPAADISEQISTASKEASGTGNMKFMLNGAVTMGTLDGANVEIHHEVGDDNIIIFGHTADEILAFEKSHSYNPQKLYQSEPRIRRAVDGIDSGIFTPPGELSSVKSSLLEWGDTYFVLSDFMSYLDAQRAADTAYRNREKWLSMSISNTARAGVFSSDVTISKYAEEIWNIKKYY